MTDFPSSVIVAVNFAVVLLHGAPTPSRNDEKENGVTEFWLIHPPGDSLAVSLASAQDLNHVLWYVRSYGLEKWRISHLHRLELSFGHLSDL